MPSFSNFLVYLSNLSDIYILSSVSFILAIVVTFYYMNSMQNYIQEASERETVDSAVRLNKNLGGKNKTIQLREIENSLTEDQIKEERRIEQTQLAAIYELLKKQEVELNTVEIDEQELKEQLNLYR